MKLSFTLNGEATAVEIDSGAMLVDIIRDLGYTGTKEGCGVGVCGLCTVLIDEIPVSSCIYIAACADGRNVFTVEGLTSLDPSLVAAFVEFEGMQCGICTPGQVVSAYALRLDNPTPTDEEIRTYMAGNLCRCTGYRSIIDSVRAYLGQ
jgi:aerobic carbon-monoxide dehydrogenase small subunit